MPLNKKASQLSLQGFVARTRLFAMISIAFDLPKASASALVCPGFFVSQHLQTGCMSPNKKASWNYR
jgi:hypothetical protein